MDSFAPMRHAPRPAALPRTRPDAKTDDGEVSCGTLDQRAADEKLCPRRRGCRRNEISARSRWIALPINLSQSYGKPKGVRMSLPGTSCQRAVMEHFRRFQPKPTEIEANSYNRICEHTPQCDIRVGTVIEATMPRVTPPRMNSRMRECP